MKKTNIPALLYQLASPVALIVLGVILFLNPDSASILISRLLGWAVLLAGIGFGIAGFVQKGTGKIVTAVICLSAGSFLLANPLILAAWAGRIIGLLLLARGVRDFMIASRRESKILSVITAVLGLLLLVLPLTASRLVFSLCGIVILIVGFAMLIDRLKERKYLLDEGDDPNIIDAL